MLVQDVVNHVRQLDRRGFKSEFSPLRNVRDRPAEKKVNRFGKHSKFLQYESKKKKKTASKSNSGQDKSSSQQILFYTLKSLLKSLFIIVVKL